MRQRNDRTAPGGSEGPWHTSLHFQGSVAVEGEALLWKPATEPPPLQPMRSFEFASDMDVEEPSTAHDGACGDCTQTMMHSIIASPDKSPEALHDDPEFDQLASALHAPIARPAPPTVNATLWNGVPVQPLSEDGAPATAPATAPSAGTTPAAARQHAVPLVLSSTLPDAQLRVRGGADATKGSMAQATETLHGMQQALDAFQPAALQDSIQDAITSIRSMQQSVSSLSGEVQSCMQQLKGWSAPGTPAFKRARREAARQRAKGPRRPYSPFLAEPFIKVRVSLMSRTHWTTATDQCGHGVLGTHPTAQPRLSRHHLTCGPAPWTEPPAAVDVRKGPDDGSMGALPQVRPLLPVLFVCCLLHPTPTGTPR